MEQTLLWVVDWKISLPTAYPFLDRFLGLTEASEMTRHTATYYLERTLQEHDLLQFCLSVVCASTIILVLNNPSIRVREGVYARLPLGPGLVSDDPPCFFCSDRLSLLFFLLFAHIFTFLFTQSPKFSWNTPSSTKMSW